MELWQFKQRMSLPRKAKVVHAVDVAKRFDDYFEGNTYCSVAGLDSLTLSYLLKDRVSKNITLASVISAEPKANQAILKNLEGLIPLKSCKSKTKVLQEEGFPLGSKDISKAIRQLQNPSDKNYVSRRGYITGIKGDGTYSKWLRLPRRWLKFVPREQLIEFIEHLEEYFRYSDNWNLNGEKKEAEQDITKNYILKDLERTKKKVQTTEYVDVKISEKCCYYTKEKALQQFSKESGLKPYMGLLADEQGHRKSRIIKKGCTILDGSSPRCLPFAYFTKSDVISLALEYDVPISSEYGKIIHDGYDINGDPIYYTDKASRTGCETCGMNLTSDRPHRFDVIQKENPKLYTFLIDKVGWGKVMDAMGVKYGDYWESNQCLESEISKIIKEINSNIELLSCKRCSQ